MSNVTSRNDRTRLSRVEYLGRGFVSALLAALPLCGLMLFFEITRPAQLHGDGAVAAELSSTGTAMQDAAFAPERRSAVARLKGVSAELRQDSGTQSGAKAFSASDAQRAFAGANYASLNTGFQTEFVTKEHRRVALRIVSRQPIVDRAVPDNARLMDFVPASTAKAVKFVWGQWLYMAEVEDKGVESGVVVQKVL